MSQRNELKYKWPKQVHRTNSIYFGQFNRKFHTNRCALFSDILTISFNVYSFGDWFKFFVTGVWYALSGYNIYPIKIQRNSTKKMISEDGNNFWSCLIFHQLLVVLAKIGYKHTLCAGFLSTWPNYDLICAKIKKNCTNNMWPYGDLSPFESNAVSSNERPSSHLI